MEELRRHRSRREFVVTYETLYFANIVLHRHDDKRKDCVWPNEGCQGSVPVTKWYSLRAAFTTMPTLNRAELA